MERSVSTTKTAVLRTKLRESWLHDLYRDLRRRIMRRSEGEAVHLREYSRVHGKTLDLTNPQTFTEKLFWRMVTWNRGAMHPKFRQLVDKYAVRAHVPSMVGEEYLIKLLWQGADPCGIPFDRLPAEYVIKSNHASGHVIIVTGEVDREAIIRQATGWLAQDYYWHAREYQYYGIQPRIVIEEHLINQSDFGPLDYRFWCFGGVPAVIQVDNHAHDINSFFDAQWNQLDLYYPNKKNPTRPAIAKPRHFEQMFELASRLSEGIGFVRVDLYNINGRIYFGEFTLTPLAGNFRFSLDHWDLELGEKWDLALDC